MQALARALAFDVSTHFWLNIFSSKKKNEQMELQANLIYVIGKGFYSSNSTKCSIYVEQVLKKIKFWSTPDSLIMPIVDQLNLI